MEYWGVARFEAPLPGLLNFERALSDGQSRLEVVDEEPIQLPIDGVLDLHTFKPREVKELVQDYLAACQQRGIYEVRIIHGKGIGQLRRTVHSILSRHPEVVSFTLDHPHYGGWGATLVQLRKPAA